MLISIISIVIDMATNRTTAGFSVEPDVLEDIDRIARSHGMTRSMYLRALHHQFRLHPDEIRLVSIAGILNKEPPPRQERSDKGKLRGSYIEKRKKEKEAKSKKKSKT